MRATTGQFATVTAQLRGNVKPPLHPRGPQNSSSPSARKLGTGWLDESAVRAVHLVRERTRAGWGAKIESVRLRQPPPQICESVFKI
jgi:hypothetical protein